MSKEEYIQQCGAQTSKDLTDRQILQYYIEGHDGIVGKSHAMMLKSKRAFGCDIDVEQGYALLRQAFDQDKIFEIHFIEGEGVIFDEHTHIGPPHFEMLLRDK